MIEPRTSEIAAAVAGEDYGLYYFEGLRDRPHRDLHITSANFSEPKCVELVTGCDLVGAVHGLDGKERQFVEVGGLDTRLHEAICTSLHGVGFSAEVVTSGGLAGLSPASICNRGARMGGVQLEITRGLRDPLRASPQRLTDFADAVRLAIAAAL